MCRGRLEKVAVRLRRHKDRFLAADKVAAGHVRQSAGRLSGLLFGKNPSFWLDPRELEKPLTSLRPLQARLLAASMDRALLCETFLGSRRRWMKATGRSRA